MATRTERLRGMGVRDLVREIAREERLARDIGVTGDDWTTLKELESALRGAVIKEASAGKVTVKITEYEDEITAPVGSPDRIVTCSERIVSQAWIPAGEYYLVCREVSA